MKEEGSLSIKEVCGRSPFGDSRRLARSPAPPVLPSPMSALRKRERERKRKGRTQREAAKNVAVERKVTSSPAVALVVVVTAFDTSW